MTLYQFPISHYCEKIRWALDYKGLPYTTINPLPGSHIAGENSVADLAAAALLAPFTTPDKYGLEWPDSYPDEMEAVVDDLRPRLKWVDEVYREFR
ncbi:hypothetical protein MNBD_GAMMA15-1204 [hydrothermal vent metagenome]|uniref:GST N-terminal domain-containing protein n=1 Tax=hydrothermal vent metagenome TaxID=652676 RepID=A0A3B0YXI3_9ZZZZ